MENWFNGQPYPFDGTSGNMDNWFMGVPETNVNFTVDVRSIKKIDVTYMSQVFSVEGGVLNSDIKFYNRVPNQ
jgi:hypothetical protein